MAVVATASMFGCASGIDDGADRQGPVLPATGGQHAPGVTTGAGGAGGGFDDGTVAAPTDTFHAVPEPDMTGIAGMGGSIMDAVPGTHVQVEPLPEPEAVDLGMGDGRDVIAIGDSWMNLGTVGIQQSLLRASGQPYRAYGVPGTRFLDGAIPGQYDRAKLENPDIKTIVVAGGGNDILMNPLALIDCPLLGEICRGVIEMIADRYLELADELAADGVEDVVIVVYSRGTAIGAAPIDYVFESIVGSIAPACESSGLRCHIVDADEVSGGTMQLRDGIHPTNANYDLLGEYIYDLMVSEGMRR